MLALLCLLPAVAGNERILQVLLLAGLAGMLVGYFQGQVLCRPFAFLLPGHRFVVARQAMATGALVGLLVALGSALSPHASPGLPLAYLPLALAAYVFGTLVGLWHRYLRGLVGLGTALVYAAAPLGWDKRAERLLDQHLALASLLALSMIPWLWRALASRGYARRCCGLREVDRSDLAAEAKEAYGRSSPGGALELGSPAAIRYLLGVIRRSRPDSLWRCCHTVCYEWTGPLALRQVAYRLVYLLGVALALGYYSRGTGRVGPLFLLPAILVLSCNYVHLRTWLPLDRRGRMKMALAELLVALLYGTILTWTPVILSHAVAPFMPTLAVRGQALAFQPLAYWYILLSFVAIPPVVALRTWAGRNRLRMVTAVVVSVLVPATVWVEFSYSVAATAWLLALGASLLSSWLAIRHRCLRRDLV